MVGAKHVVVAVNYFIKWVEAEPLAKVINFLVRNVICRYKIPLQIILDNGLQLDNEDFADFCQQHEIWKSFSTMAHS